MGRPWGIFFGFYKTSHILLSDSANSPVLCAIVLTQYRHVTDGRTDWQTDGIAVAITALATRTLWRAVKTFSSYSWTFFGPGATLQQNPNWATNACVWTVRRSAIEEGKAIFYNIRNFVRFQLSTWVHCDSVVHFYFGFVCLENPCKRCSIPLLRN